MNWAYVWKCRRYPC